MLECPGGIHKFLKIHDGASVQKANRSAHCDCLCAVFTYCYNNRQAVDARHVDFFTRCHVLNKQISSGQVMGRFWQQRILNMATGRPLPS